MVPGMNGPIPIAQNRAEVENRYGYDLVMLQSHEMGVMTALEYTMKLTHVIPTLVLRVRRLLEGYIKIIPFKH